MLRRFVLSLPNVVLEALEASDSFLVPVRSPLSHPFDSCPELDSRLAGTKENFLLGWLFLPPWTPLALGGGGALRDGFSEFIPAEST